MTEAPKPSPSGVTEEMIKHMANRFLGWKLPHDFHPDAGISFEPEFNKEWNARHGMPPQRHEPSGTNLFDAEQATAMVRYMVEGLPALSQPSPAGADYVVVPREPTEAMLKAMFCSHGDGIEVHPDIRALNDAINRKQWLAALAAAPAQPAPNNGGTK